MSGGVSTAALNYLKGLSRFNQVQLFIGLMITIMVCTGGKIIQEHFSLDQFTLVCAVITTGLVFAWQPFKITIIQFWGFWLAAAGWLMCYVGYEWPLPANHVYVYIYLCLILAIVLKNGKEDRLRILKTNTTLLFVLIMVFAVIQKLITPGYLDGTINAFWFTTGGYGKPIYLFTDEWKTIVESNHELLNVYYNVNFSRVGTVKLNNPIVNLKSWSIAFTYIVLLGEIILPLIFVFSKRQLFKHGAVLLFVPMVFLTRQESGFLSILCILSVAQCSLDQPWIRLAYLLMIGVMQALFIFNYGYI